MNVLETILGLLGMKKDQKKKNTGYLKLFGGDIHLHFHINLYKVIDETRKDR